YNCQEIGDIERVGAFLKEGHPVIISVKRGYFTTTGHIMVMSGVDEKGDFWINETKDSKEKSHSKRTFTSEEVMNEAL
ncbi:C39 family peptidase, partial [Enterococcus faecalis]|uniref:C39 family peptidase n=1 Tax=Enterococcus faecalis TaxID=1351 RepID=UPI003D6B9173